MTLDLSVMIGDTHEADLALGAQSNDDFIELKAVPKYFPHRRGKPVGYGAVWRWARHGSRGVVLQTVRIGGMLYTTRQAIRDFITLTSQRQMSAAEIRAHNKQQRATNRANKKFLRDQGIVPRKPRRKEHTAN